MPEGPEIKQEADRIARVLEGMLIEEAVFTPAPLQGYAEVLRDRRVTTVCSRGKAMLISFDLGLTLYSHNQLYGRWFTRKDSSLPKTNRQLRVALYTERGVACLYSASEIAILTENELATHPFLTRLGPDVLHADLGSFDIIQRLTQKEFARRRIGNLYLDQSFLAGIGNYLRSEILFDAALNPQRAPRDLSPDELSRLAASTLTICWRAYRKKGVVNDPKRVARLKLQGLKRRDYRFAAFARKGQPCYRCGAIIQRETMASRRIYLCHGCQI